jgi:hypothetical protein
MEVKMNLTSEQIEDYKNRLRNDKLETSRTLQKPSIRNLWASIIYKYSGQAHFLYEVIQNADDAGATNIHFALYDDKVVFRHNGKKHFSISDVEKEAEDQEKGTLGDINSILAVGFSSKANEKIENANEPKIGKFGVGFKSVFQYTNTPIIYDQFFRFKITDYIVPNWLEEDYPGRKDEETVFVLPFNRESSTPQKARDEILEKIQKLIMPILFLHSIKEITYEYNDVRGRYAKEEMECFDSENVQARKYKVVNGGEDKQSLIWIFSRNDEKCRTFSVGFFVDESGKLIPQPNYFAFCFFPTKVVSHLNFIIHAPFLLTDSREGIQSGSEYNKKMISNLAQLSADALKCFVEIGEKHSVRMIDDGIIKIIPIKRADFEEVDSDTISFAPFYNVIQKKMKAGLLPTKDGCVAAENACWAETINLNELISKEQLQELTASKVWNCNTRSSETKISKKEWVFTSFGKRDNLDLDKYLKEMQVDSFLLDDLLQKMKAPFIESQDIGWLCSLYNLINKNDKSRGIAQYLPIFLNEHHKATSAFLRPAVAYQKPEPNLYLSSANSHGYNVVLPDIERNEFGLNLLREMKVFQPSLKDKIVKKILLKGEFDEINDFKDILDYYIECANKGQEAQKKDVKDNIINKKFIAVTDVNGNAKPNASPDEIYFLNEELKVYFANYNEAAFVDEKKYNSYLSEEEKRNLHEFLQYIGVSDYAKIKDSDVDVASFFKASGRDIDENKITRCCRYFLTGAEDFLYALLKENELEKSKILLHQMVVGYKLANTGGKDKLFGYRCEYMYYGKKKVFATSKITALFRNKKWLVDNSGNWVSPQETYLGRLAGNYDISNPDVKNFLTVYLGVREEHPEYNTLSDDLRKKVELSDFLEKYGLNDISLEEIQQIKKMREKKTDDGASIGSGDGNGNGHAGSSTTKKTSDDNSDTDENDQDNTPEKKITKEIAKLAENKKKGASGQSDDDSEEDDADEDEYTKASVDYTKKIQKAKDKCAVEVNELKEYEAAQKLAVESKKYSYQWFSALLKLEMLSSNENNSNSREVSISFSKVKKDPNSKKTLILEQPNKNIPSVIEELYGINLNLRMKDGSEKSLPFEASSIKSYSLRVMLMHPDQLIDLDLNQVTSASIIAKSPVFLLQELQKQFDTLSFATDFDMKSSLCENIKFVFGPPGTGKTTFLARNVLKKLIEENKNIKILVLAPTNKAADVIVNRTIDVMSGDEGYKNWLARFGVTNDESIEEKGIFCSKNYDIEKHNQNVVVTTIARYPYDGMKCEGKDDQLLRDVKWDYVVIDEASMISLVQIIYVLYSQKPKQFIIAGDPFQIEPTTAVDLWKDENIYKMVKLDSFTNIHTEPHKFAVELLKTQYRSIPSVGKIFSALTYEDSLIHYRKEESRRALNIEEFLSYGSLNLVKFPVHKYESIYRSKKLNKSNYQIYSALFAYEFTYYLAKKIAEKNPSEHFKIGVISPYAAQAKLINNLLVAEKIPDSASVLCGTIHGFQGDECDVLVTVFNAPESISNSDKMFLNRKNIINVAISRAKDYLFVLMPDDKTEKIENLKLVKNVESLMKSNPSCTEIGSHELEKKMFGNETYLEENTFSTGHQSVNVYGIPEKKYEVRSEEDAIDIQIHK